MTNRKIKKIRFLIGVSFNVIKKNTGKKTSELYELATIRQKMEKLTYVHIEVKNNSAD